MNKTELIKSIAKKGEVTNIVAEKTLNAFIETIKETLLEGEKVRILGFGNFEAKERKAREGHNPKDPSQKIMIPTSIAPTFKAGKVFKAFLNKK